MPNVNIVVLAGHLTRDPELRYTPNGAAVCDFSLAVNRRWTDNAGQKKEDVSFIDCVAWAKTAELVSTHLKKGSAALVEGEIRQERWEDSATGGQRSRVKVNVARVTFLGRKVDDASPGRPADEPAVDENIPF
jgi:single-strand DNA-binding protein